MKAVKPDLAQSINVVRALLKRDFGSDFSFSIHGNGEVIAQSNILFSQAPIPLRQPMKTTLMKTKEHCIYCGAELPEQTTEREGDWRKTHDWKAERELHNEGCEWVETRAHTQTDPETENNL